MAVHPLSVSQLFPALISSTNLHLKTLNQFQASVGRGTLRIPRYRSSLVIPRSNATCSWYSTICPDFRR